MTFDINKPVRTVGGRAARIVCTDRKGVAPLVVLVQGDPGEELLRAYTMEGLWFNKQYCPEDHLENIPERHVHADCIIAWANGAEIECNDGFGWFVTPAPTWVPGYKYRVKQ